MVRLLPVLLLTACLDDPQLKTCDEFPPGTEGCCADLPIGTEGCPTACEIYCGLMVEGCGDAFESEGACQAACIETRFEEGQPDDTEGDSVECRIEWAQRGECKNAVLDGSEACITNACATYCDLMASNCPAAFPMDPTYCPDICAVLPSDPGNDADANTVQCRIKYAQEGACDNAHTNGGDGSACGDPCEPYCELMGKNCTGENAQYDNDRACMETCALLDAGGTHNDWDFDIEGETLQCRTYHIGRPAALDPATHCPHAAVYNHAHCGETNCEVYCNLVERHCAGGDFVRAACERICEARERAGEELDVPGAVSTPMCN